MILITTNCYELKDAELQARQSLRAAQLNLSESLNVLFLKLDARLAEHSLID